MKGQQPKSESELRIAGTLRKSRHSTPSPSPPGTPQKPEWVTGEAAWLWDLVIVSYGTSGPLTMLDSAVLGMAADFWRLYRAASVNANADATDKNARLAVNAYGALFEKLAGRLGLNPVDRRRLRLEGSKTNPDDARKRSYFA